MRELTHKLLTMVRLLGMMEKDQVCCGEVTVPQCVVLQQLLNGPSKVTDLAGFAGLSPSAMTRLLDGLERKEWVTRVHAATDRRKVLIELTPSGKEQAEQLRGLTEASVEMILSYVPNDERETVIHSIELLSDAVEQAMEKGIPCCGPGACDP